jgi:hypothetical protein
LCTEIFGKSDIGLIEREFLEVLDFQLGVKENDLLAHRAIIISNLSKAGRGIKREREQAVQTNNTRCKLSS